MNDHVRFAMAFANDQFGRAYGDRFDERYHYMQTDWWQQLFLAGMELTEAIDDQ